MTDERVTKQPHVPLLSAMARDLSHDGSLRPRTATVMWVGYAAHAVLNGWALRSRGLPLPLPGKSARVAGGMLVGAGTGLCVAGMSRFTSPRELTGTSNEELTTAGIYRYSRNPQYLGYPLALTGAALARRSGAAVSLSALLAAVYATWVPVEERHLSALFGEAYHDYTQQTRRWWGRHRQAA